MASTIKLKRGSGEPGAGALVEGEPAFDLTNKRLYTENSGGTVLEIGTNPTTLQVDGTLTVGVDDTGYDVEFFGATTGKSMLWDESADSLIIEGNVGIGTSTPDEALEVSGDLKISGSSFGILHFGETSDVTKIVGRDADHASLANTLDFFTAGTQRMTIDSSGRVIFGDPDSDISGLVFTGLATTDPVINTNATGAEFVAYRTDNAVNGGDFIGAYLFGNDDNDATEDHFAGMWAKATGTAGSMDLHFAAGKAEYEADSAQMTITSDGNVGIGVTPAFASGGGLHVHDSTVGRIHLTGGSSGTAAEDGFQLAHINVDSYVWNYEAGPLIFATSNTERFRIASDGSLSTPTLGTDNVRFGENAGNSIASGGLRNVLIGTNAGTAITTGDSNIAIGWEALKTEDTHGNNIAIGASALATQNAGADAYNVGIGYNAGTAVTTGTINTLIGSLAGDAITTGNSNVAVGYGSLSADTTGDRSTALGFQALSLQNFTSNTDTYNVAVGYNSGYSVTTGIQNTLIGGLAGDSITTANNNTALGYNSLGLNITGNSNVAIGYAALDANTTASNNIAVGASALTANTTGVENTAVGHTAGASNTTSSYSTFIGKGAGYYSTSAQNTYLGEQSGYYVTSGAKNTILGRYSGNQGGLDIRTTSNNIVLSDGDGNPRVAVNSSGTAFFGAPVAPSSSQAGISLGLSGPSGGSISIANTLTSTYAGAIKFINGNGQVGHIETSGSSTSYVTSSDYRLKENVVYTWDATTRLKQLKPVRFNFIADADTTVDGFLAHEAQAVVAEAVSGTHNEVDDDGNAVMQGIDQSKLVPLLVKAVQEQQTLIETLTARIEALEG